MCALIIWKAKTVNVQCGHSVQTRKHISNGGIYKFIMIYSHFWHSINRSMKKTKSVDTMRSADCSASIHVMTVLRNKNLTFFIVPVVLDFNTM